jgi:hypothetical protein
VWTCWISTYSAVTTVGSLLTCTLTCLMQTTFGSLYADRLHQLQLVFEEYQRSLEQLLRRIGLGSLPEHYGAYRRKAGKPLFAVSLARAMTLAWKCAIFLRPFGPT